MRKLVSIQRVKSLEHVDEKLDYLKFVDVEWGSLVPRGSFKENDLVVLFEIDCIVYQMPGLTFMGGSAYHVKTVEYNGYLSQGLVAGLDILNELNLESIEVGMDLTSLLGVEKFDEGTTILGKKKFPDDLANKTDETRLEIMPGILQEFPGVYFFGRIKFHGESSTFIKELKKPLRICSREKELTADQKGPLYVLAEKINMAERMDKFLIDWGAQAVSMQAELLGPGVVKNHYNLKNHILKVFDLFIPIQNGNQKGIYVDQELMDALVHTYFGDKSELISMSNLAKKIKLDGMSFEDMEALVRNVPSVLNSEVQEEGIVWRPSKEILDNRIFFANGRVSFKTINNEFLKKGN